MKKLTQTNIVEAIEDPKLFAPLFGGWFKDAKTWSRWHVFLRALFGLPMGEDDLEVFKTCTGLDAPPRNGVDEAWLICGRRSGKSRMLALVAAYLATMIDWSPYLAGGERGTVMVVATDKKQARVIFGYVRDFLTKVRLLAPLIERETNEALELTNGINIEILPASYRTLRGYTVVAALLDEIAFWRTDEGSANPDKEIVGAIRPAMSTVTPAKLLVASSPYAKRGELFETYQRYFAKPGADALVWKAPSKYMNPSLSQKVIDKAYQKDPADAAAEYGAEFRSDISSWLDLAIIQAAVDGHVTVRPPIAGVRYVSFIDPSGGAHDSFTAAVAHLEANIAVLDCVVEVKAPFNPDEAVAQIAGVLKSYGITRTKSDRYAGKWPPGAMLKEGVTVDPSERDRSAIYLDCLPLFTTGRVRLVCNDKLVTQFAGLVRTTSPGGRDKVEKPKNGSDDVANAAAGALVLAAAGAARRGALAVGVETFGSSRDRAGGMVADGKYTITQRPHISASSPGYAEPDGPEHHPPADLSMVWDDDTQTWVKPWIDPRSR